MPKYKIEIENNDGNHSKYDLLFACATRKSKSNAPISLNHNNLLASMGLEKYHEISKGPTGTPIKLVEG